MAYNILPIGGAVITSIWYFLCEVTAAHTKFGVIVSQLCRDTAF